ncbi:TetR family transcriptional regulator [Microbacterium sp. NPDC089320]|uniref:TetR family transcriptional regulator n=1 Tax=Microbacterium sp. NPDC089320 TaxID=3155182 RepID=UPI0034420788
MRSDWHTQSRDILRARLAVAATDIFAAEGFDAVSAESVAHRLGISRATFFRYFASKDEAVLSTLTAPDGGYGQMLDAFDGLEVLAGESVWVAITRTLTAVGQLNERGQIAVRDRVRMVMTTPSLRTRFQEDRRERETRLADALERSLRDRLVAEVAAAASLSALDAAWRRWAADTSGRSRFIDVARDAFQALEAAGSSRP